MNSVFILLWIASSLTMYTREADAQLSQALDELTSEAVSIFTAVTAKIKPDAQQSQALDELASEAISIFTGATAEVGSMYTELTSIVDNPSGTPATASVRTTSHPVTSTSRSSSSASTQLAASSSTTTADASNNGNGNLVAIIVGTILGAVVLGLLILLALLCLRRRRRRARDELSPSNAEVESWRLTTESRGDLPGAARNTRATAGHDHAIAATAGAGAVGAGMVERNRNERHRNPFVPIPPPPRRTAPNSRTGLTDGSVPGQEPYSAVRPRSSIIHPAHRDQSEEQMHQHDTHQLGKEIAVGAGGAALGAAAMKHHNQKKENRKESFELSAESSPPQSRRSVSRKPVPPVSLPADNPSMESTLLSNRSSFDNYGNGHKSGIVSPLSPDPVELPSPTPERQSMGNRRPSNEPLLGEGGGAAAGLFAGAALANRRHHDREQNDRPGVHRDDSFKIEMPNHGQNGTQYEPYRSDRMTDSESLPMPPPAAWGAVHRHRRSETPPDVPTRSPARLSFSRDTPPTDSSSESLNTSAARGRTLQALEGEREAGDRTSDTIPVMWRRSAENTRALPKGITYHDFQPVQRESNALQQYRSGESSFESGRDSGSSSGSGTSAYAQGKGGKKTHGGRRVSLNDLIEDERKRMEGERQKDRERYYSGAPRMPGAYDGSEYGVGQAL